MPDSHFLVPGEFTIDCFRNVSKFIGKNKSILDAGCDDARLSNFIKNIKHYTGVDSNREVIEQNRKRFEKHDNIDFSVADLDGDLKFNERYDVVVLAAVIEHLKDLPGFLSKIKRATHKDSLVLITTPLRKSDRILKVGARLGIFSKESLDEHQDYFSRKDFADLADWKLRVYETFEFGLNQLVALARR